MSVDVISLISVLYGLFKDRRAKNGDAALAVKPVFFNILREKPRIFAVHQYEKSDDVSGYRPLGQNSRPDQQEKLIKLKVDKAIFGIKYEIKPLRASDILAVIISRNGREKNKVILFNKEAF